jgi:CRISPR/Cas system-associated exonuclease Cas4 (RecB family)
MMCKRVNIFRLSASFYCPKELYTKVSYLREMQNYFQNASRRLNILKTIISKSNVETVIFMDYLFSSSL